jgi:hypothetical protein
VGWPARAGHGGKPDLIRTTPLRSSLAGNSVGLAPLALMRRDPQSGKRGGTNKSCGACLRLSGFRMVRRWGCLRL